MATKKSRRNPNTRRMKKSTKSNRGFKQIALFTILRDDNKKLKDIMDNILNNSDDSEIMSESFIQLKEELKIHSRAEEASVYQPMKANDDTRFLSIHAHEENALVEHLIEHEESEIFNKLKNDFSIEELDMMAENMITLKKEEMENTFIDSI